MSPFTTDFVCFQTLSKLGARMVLYPTIIYLATDPHISAHSVTSTQLYTSIMWYIYTEKLEMDGRLGEVGVYKKQFKIFSLHTEIHLNTHSFIYYKPKNGDHFTKWTKCPLYYTLNEFEIPTLCLAKHRHKVSYPLHLGLFQGFHEFMAWNNYTVEQYIT